jgi:hypothetical protein
MARPAPARCRAETMRGHMTRVHRERPVALLAASGRGHGKRAHALGRAGRIPDGSRVVRILLRASWRLQARHAIPQAICSSV